MTEKINKEAFERMKEIINKPFRFKGIKGEVEVAEENGIVRIGSLIAPIQVIKDLLAYEEG